MYFIKFIIYLDNLEYDFLKCHDNQDDEINYDLWFDEDKKIKFIMKYKDKPYKFTLYRERKNIIYEFPITIKLVNGYQYKVILNLDEKQNDYFIYE
jgi:hypothetical protein